MNSLTRFSFRGAFILAAIVPLLSLPAAAAGHGCSCGGGTTATAVSSTGPFDLDQARAEYPLTTCVVSGETLGDMGTPVDYVHKEDGRPDRLVRFCCKSCLKDFKKDPAAHLAKIDAAARKKGAGPAPGAHQH